MALSLLASCVPSTFSGISLFGLEIVSINATLVTNYSTIVPIRFTQPAVQVQNATFCNVAVSYIHPGLNNTITAEAWLPIENSAWNGRFQMVGGGGWVAGRHQISYTIMEGGIAEGFASLTTDAGLPTQLTTDLSSILPSPGNINMNAVENFGYRSLYDGALIGKAAVKSFYGRDPEFSYWNGCSQGGRQGLMLAQRYPKVFDGISIGAPAMYITKLGNSLYWSQQVMNNLKSYPYGCELQALSTAAIAACDGLDGVVDGIISVDTKTCLAHFDPFQLVGTPIPNCPQANNRTVSITNTAVIVANETWNGVRLANGAWSWHGLTPGTDISSDGSQDPSGGAAPALAATKCDNNGTCVGLANPLIFPWFDVYHARGDPSFDVLNLTHTEFDDVAFFSHQIYGSALDTDEPDLSRFRDAGGKMISFHGLYDDIIAPGSTEQYYNDVANVLPDVHSFYRHFEVPGLGHCFGRSSGQPESLFDQLRSWVENGTVPEQSPIDVRDQNGEVHHRIICPYPKKATFDKAGCGDPANATCWSCKASACPAK